MKVSTAAVALAAAMATGSAALGAMYNQTLTEYGYATANDGFSHPSLGARGSEIIAGA